MKKYEQWQGSMLEFGKFAQPKDVVDQEIVDWFASVVPPTSHKEDYVQCGEPMSAVYDDVNKKWRNIYTTFKKVDGNWMYCGHCYKGKVTHKIGNYATCGK